jgi:hypothetical protein
VSAASANYFKDFASVLAKKLGKKLGIFSATVVIHIF